MNKTVPSEGQQPPPGKGLQREPRTPADLVDQGSGTLDPSKPRVTGEGADRPNPDNEE